MNKGWLRCLILLMLIFISGSVPAKAAEEVLQIPQEIGSETEKGSITSIC